MFSWFNSGDGSVWSDMKDIELAPSGHYRLNVIDEVKHNSKRKKKNPNDKYQSKCDKLRAQEQETHQFISTTSIHTVIVTGYDCVTFSPIGWT